MESDCIIHYKDIAFSKNLIPVTVDTHKTLKECKEIRLNLGGENLHYEQSHAVPDEYDGNTQLLYHRECRSKFTYAKTLQKRKNTTTQETRSSKRSKDTFFFPNYCMFCKKSRMQVKKKDIKLTKILTLSTQEKVRQAAQLKNDVEMLAAVTEIDLIAKEFQKHDICYREYTRELWEVNTNEDKSADLYQRGDYQGVCNFIDTFIIGEMKCMSLQGFLELYGPISWPNQYRYKLKSRLLETYGERLLFVTAEENTPQIVISKESLTQHPGSIRQSDEFFVKEAATILKQAVLQSVTDTPDLPWPPTVASLQSREPPELLRMFYDNLLKPQNNNHSVSVKRERLIDSFCSDVMFAISNGNYLTLKNVALGLGLHNKIGMKSPIELLHRLGHCISYDQVNLIETAQAELVQHYNSLSLQLPLFPRNSESKVSTIFWWDNLDRNIETATGSGSIHNTPGIAFQEISDNSIPRKDDVTIPKSGRRSISITDIPAISYSKITPKVDPPIFAGPVRPPENTNVDLKSNTLLKLWKSLRKLSTENQIYPRFSGWIWKQFQSPDQTSTQLAYLPPIQKPITDYGTIFEIFYTSRKLSQLANMLYTHITFDLGAAMKAYHVIWNNPELWHDIIIHLGDFHAMMTFFAVIGTFVNGSGFEEVVFQTDLCSSGSIKGLISGKQYNRCWMTHEVFSEALERLFVHQYVGEMPQSMLNEINARIKDDKLSHEERAFLQKYEEQKRKALNGEFGKTPQYWTQYVNLIDRQYKLHLAIKTNDFDLRLKLWDESLPLCFATNRLHYARYGTYYLNQLRNLHITHPGAKEEITNIGLSVRRNNAGIGQAIDLAGEQTYMRSAKTPGGITMFANSNEAVSKWVMNRPFVSKFNEAIEDLCGLTKSANNPQKCLRPSEIRKSELMVNAVMETLCTHFLNPFSEELDAEKLYNIVSGAPTGEDICESLLGLESKGKSLKEEFETRLYSDSGNSTDRFFTTIKKNKFKSFEDTNIKVTVEKDGKQVEIAYQRDILGILVSQSYTSKTGVDIDKVFTYPLAPVSIPLCTPDGKNRKTAKSKLYDTAMSDLRIISENTLHEIPNLDTYYLDIVASIRTLTGTSGTIRNLAWKILQMIPKQFTNIYLVCDTYKEGSIKGGERRARGTGKRYILKSPDMKVPSDFCSFLKNGDNKTMMLNLLEQAIMEDKVRLKSRVVYFSNADHCRRISALGSDMMPNLSSNHEEADTKLVALIESANIPTTNNCIFVRSPSGDIDILVLFLLHFANGPRVLIDNGTGKARKIIDVSSSGLSLKYRKALAGMHAFSGNDYVSSFFRKGKIAFWKKIISSQEFIELFGNLVNFNYEKFETFICALYGYPKQSSVDKVRALMYINKFKKDNETVDLCNLPPCAVNLKLHFKRASYVANMYNQANSIMMEIGDPRDYEWDMNGNSIWSRAPYPADITDLLINSGKDENELAVYDPNDDDVGERYPSEN